MPLSLLMSLLCLGCFCFALLMLTRVQASEFDTDGDCLYALTQELLLLRTSSYNIGSVAFRRETYEFVVPFHTRTLTSIPILKTLRRIDRTQQVSCVVIVSS